MQTAEDVIFHILLLQRLSRGVESALPKQRTVPICFSTLSHFCLVMKLNSQQEAITAGGHTFVALCV